MIVDIKKLDRSRILDFDFWGAPRAWLVIGLWSLRLGGLSPSGRGRGGDLSSLMIAKRNQRKSSAGKLAVLLCPPGRNAHWACQEWPSRIGRGGFLLW
jgi:hypothetical protein